MRATKNPLVQECEETCLFKNDNNSWCIDATPPAIELGWEWVQASGTTTEDPIADWWQIELKPYVDTLVYYSSIYDVTRLIYNKTTFDLTEFKTNYFFSVIWNDYQRWCPGMGWEIESVDFQVLVINKFQDCYKVLIDDFCDWTIFKGEDAKYIDKCEQNEDEVEVTAKEYHWQDAKQDIAQYGTVHPTSVDYCYKIPAIGQDYPASPLTNMTSNLMRWVGQKYVEKK